MLRWVFFFLAVALFAAGVGYSAVVGTGALALLFLVFLIPLAVAPFTGDHRPAV